MNKPIVVGDWTRILRGDSPWLFVLEAMLRLFLLYLLLLVALRLMGRRMSSQLSRNELLALVSLAAVIGPPMQSPEHGLLPPLLVAAWVVVLQRIMAIWTFRSHRFEHLMNGRIATLVSDGRVNVAEVRRASLPLQRVHAQLRFEGITNLGEVERLYFEPGGSFSTVRAARESPGLSVVPGWDRELRARQKIVPGSLACRTCGQVTADADQALRCASCGSDKPWTEAVCGRDKP
jgi:uncharacterized membrane protein YcaP (DUF421 family)